MTEQSNVQVGEIVGWRLWRYQDTRLKSLTREGFDWEPHCPSESPTPLGGQQTVEFPDWKLGKARKVLRWVSPGIFAFKHQNDLSRESELVAKWLRRLCEQRLYNESLIQARDPNYISPWLKQPRPLLVLGQVSLWGEVVEHSRGYRASHAYPKRFLGAVSLTRDRQHECPAITKHLNKEFGLE